MKFTCTQENLSRGLNAVSKIIDRNASLPILNNILLRARKDGIVLTATNLEIAVKTRVRGKIEEEGDFTAQGRLLADFINTLHKENITVTLEEKILLIQGENHQTSIRGLDATDFPVIPDVGTGLVLEVKSELLREALAQTVFSMSADDARPELSGGFFQVSDKKCVIAATDSYRLSEKTIVLEQGHGEGRSVIVPARTLNEVLRILDLDAAETTTVRINDTQILFSLGETEVVSRVITGNYPDYHHIIPKDFKSTIEFSVSEMEQSVKTTSLFCKQGINDIRLTIDERFDDIAVQAENATFGKNVSHVKNHGKKSTIDIVFNYKFLLDGLLHLGDERAYLKLNDAGSAALLTAKKENSFLYIIMPIRQ